MTGIAIAPTGGDTMPQSVEKSLDQIRAFFLALRDNIVDALVTVDSEHHKVHIGETMIVGYSTPDASPLADNASLDLWASVPAGQHPHIEWEMWCEGLAQIYVYEGPTVSDEGTLLVPHNRNRNYADESPGLTVKHTPTVTDTGIPLHDGRWIGGPGPGNQPGETGSSRAAIEIVLKPETTYLFRVTSRDSGQRASIALDWY